MRLSKRIDFGIWVAAAIVMSTTPRANSAEVRDVGETEFFSVDAGVLVAQYDASHIVSDPPIIKASFYQMDSSPHLVVPTGSEAYLLEPETRADNLLDYRIVGIKPRGKAITGELFLIRRHPDQPRERVLARFEFHVDAQPEVKASRKDFFLAKGRHFQRLWSEQMAGSAMFRHLATTSLQEVGKTARSTGPSWPLRSNDGVDSTIRLVSGGRAVSENLQLDAQLIGPQRDRGKLVSLADVQGITVREINWAPMLKNEPTQLDRLSKLVPHDQYAVYLPSFQALADIVDRGSELANPAMQWIEPQSRQTDVMGFYQTQLALPLNALTRRVGGALIGEVAVTGSDPYFRTGTDIGVMMQSDQPQLLHQSMLTQVAAQAARHTGVKRVEHQVDGYTFTQWATENRRLSSFVAFANQTVIVTNSLHQMIQILSCADDRGKAMHELDEYRFFRQRYPRQDAGESALIVITDAAIRRWCGPQWRISAARRTRARATIAEITMQYADDLVRDSLRGKTEIHAAAKMPEAGSMIVSADGVYSKTYGTLDFQTPIAELQLQQASQAEVDLYTRWRNQYEQRWRREFDPIALQISLTENSMHADLSVIPLMIRSDYQQFLMFVGSARLKPGFGDRHPESLASFDIAIDTRSWPIMMLQTAIANDQNNFDLVSWIDDSASIYLDEDQEWLARLSEHDPWDQDFDDLLRDVPVGLFIPSKNNLRMTAFVVAVRSAIQRFAPNMIRWENAKHGNFEYVVGTPVAGNRHAAGMPHLYYVTTAEGLTVSTNRGVIERTVDRHAQRQQRQIDPPDLEPEPEAELSPQVVAKVTGKGAEMMARTNYRNGLRRANRISWSNIPILNYLRQRYPNREPDDVYRKLFGEQLVEPTGGEYVWNEERGTFVSSLHGYHLEPTAGPALAPSFGPGDEIETSISFQDRGLRATLSIKDN